MGYELADILKDHIDVLKLTPHQLNVLYDILACRTAEAGIHKLKCDNTSCYHFDYSYNSCRNKNCPKCSGSKQIKWVNGRNQELLPVDYSFITIVSPSYLDELFKYNQLECYNIFFKSVNETIKLLSIEDKKNTHKAGLIAMLHTWTQEVKYHPHIHCLIPEGQFNTEKNRWERINNKILTKEIFNITFKKVFANNLVAWMNKNEFSFLGITPEYILGKSRNTGRCVHIRRSIKDVTGVVKYLGTYSNNIAITNNRIVDYDGTEVTISCVDRADGNKIKNKKIPAVIFLQRYSLHILPRKFSKIRYYGFLANSCKSKYISACKEQLKKEGKKLSILDQQIIKRYINLVEKYSKGIICPICHQGSMVLVT